MAAAKTKNAASYKELLRGGKWFYGLEEDFQDKLLGMAMVRTFAREERVFSRGDAPSGIYGVVDGALRMTTTMGGREVLLAIVERPQWIGEIALFDDQPRSHDAIADGDATVVHVPQSALSTWLSEEPRAWRSLGMLLTVKMRLVLSAMAEVTTLPLPARLARRLVVMAEGYGEHRIGTARTVDVRQEQLATMLWTSRQTVNRCLKDLEAKGVVRVAYKTIEIVDIDGLRREAEGIG